MHESSSAAPLSTRALDRLRPVAEHVDAFTRESGRAVVAGDATLAEALLAADGERARCESAVQAAWSDILGGQSHVWPDMAADVSLLASLEKIADLASTICRAVIGLPSGRLVSDVPSIQKLAELVPDMLRDALGAVRENDRSSAKRVLDRGLAMDTWFAQTHLDVLQAVPPGTSDLTVARQFHTLSRALERIGDRAGEIAASVHTAARLS
jgi:phosphate transport system protein